MKHGKVLCLALVAIGLGFVTCSTSLAGVTTTGSIADSGSSSGDLTVGFVGDGTLTIDGGSSFTRATSYLGGGAAGVTGTATVTGAGSVWNNTNALSIGIPGSGKLTVSNGGLVTAQRLYASLSDLYGNGTITVTKGAMLDADLVFDSTHGLTQAIPFGTGGTLNLTLDPTTGILGVGYKGSGTLQITGGSKVNVSSGYVGGYTPGFNSTAVVSGAGSQWNASYQLSIPRGTLTVSDGGVVTTGTLNASLSNLYGNGTITATSGATLDADLVFDATHGPTQVIPFGTGGQLNLTVASSGTLGVGCNSNGTLRIAGGITVTTNYGNLGSGTGSSGTATVTGTGTTWAASQLYVGKSGSGNLRVEAGGQLNGMSAYLGYASGSSGTATVTGSGSKLTSSGSLYVGQNGTGSLTVDAGAQVSSNASYIGYSVGVGAGSVTVTGGGSTWTTVTNLNVGGNSDAALNVQAGGQVSSGSCSVGTHSGHTATVMVTGTNSTLNNSQDMSVGCLDGGQLNVSDGGRVIVGQTFNASTNNLSGNGTITASGAVLDGDIVFDSTHQTTAAVPFGTGGLLSVTPTSSGNLGAGYKGTGTLQITGGAKVSSNQGVLGSNTGSNGTATVSGAGTTWTNQHNITIGDQGAGILNIQGGGQYTSQWSGYDFLGVSMGSSGTLNVTGGGSTFTSKGTLQVGNYGSGNVNVTSGGKVTCVDGNLGGSGGGSAIIAGANSNWTSSGTLTVGSSGTGDLKAQTGASINSVTAYIGDSSGHTGTATVSGTNSQWNNSGTMYVGAQGKLIATDGGRITAGSLCASLNDISGNGTITVTGGAVLDTDLKFDATHGMSNTFSFGSGGTLNVNITSGGVLGAGYKGAGTLRIADGKVISSASGYLGYYSGSTSIAEVSGAGSTWANSGNLYVGNYGIATMNMRDGGKVTTAVGYIASQSQSMGAVAVTGGSTWTNSSFLYVGLGGRGTLNVQTGGQVSSTSSYIGWGSGATGEVTVTGTNSSWASSGTVYVGGTGNGTMTVTDGGQVSALSLNVYNAQSTVRLNVSGNGMLVLGLASSNGTMTNNGKVGFYANAFLANSTYTPISAYVGKTITWWGTGTYNAIGGTWTSNKFNVSAAKQAKSGNACSFVTGQRIVVTDDATGEQAGASFGSVTGSPTLTASLMSTSETTALKSTAGFSGTLLSGWDFSTTNFSGSEAMLAFNVGTDWPDVAIWHYSGGAWSPYTADDMLTYDSQGIVSFIVTDMGSYAVTAVPEPATMAMLTIGALAMLRRRRTPSTQTTR